MFLVDGVETRPPAATTRIVTSGLTLPKDVNAAVVSQRAYANARPGVHRLSVRATQSDGQSVSATGNFEIVSLGHEAQPAKNIIILLGDGMGVAHRTGLSVLMGGGRKWFLPNGDAPKADGSREGQPMNGSQRDSRSDYDLPGDIVAGWDAAPRKKDPGRDLIGDFERAGYRYAPDRTTLLAQAAQADKMLGLFAYSNMNVVFDKIGHRQISRGLSTP